MIIRQKPVDVSAEKQIIKGMITSIDFLKGIKSIYRPGIFQTDYVNIVADWIWLFFEKYKDVPKKEISSIFLEKKGEIEEEQHEIIELFLTNISEEYEDEDFNALYNLDKAEKYFKRISLEKHKFDFVKKISKDDIEGAEQLIENFTKIQQIQITAENPFSTKNIISALSEESSDNLFKFHGTLGDEIGYLERGFLFSFIAEPGVGKTWWLLYLALRGLFSGYKVLFASFEMTKKQIKRRLIQWATGFHTKFSYDKESSILIPVWDCVDNQNGKCPNGSAVSILNGDRQKPFHPEHVPCTVCKGTPEFLPTSWKKREERSFLETGEVLKKMHGFKKKGFVKNENLLIEQFPSREISMSDFNSYLDRLEDFGFTPDIIVTDYADKFKSNQKDEIHSINSVWEGHKTLALKKNILVATASQSNTVRTGGDIKKGNWAGNITKHNLIDVGLAINQTEIEKENGIYRGEILKKRNEDFLFFRQVHILNCLKIGRPYIDSYIQEI